MGRHASAAEEATTWRSVRHGRRPDPRQRVQLGGHGDHPDEARPHRRTLQQPIGPLDQLGGDDRSRPEADQPEPEGENLPGRAESPVPAEHRGGDHGRKGQADRPRAEVRVQPACPRHIDAARVAGEEPDHHHSHARDRQDAGGQGRDEALPKQEEIGGGEGQDRSAQPHEPRDVHEPPVRRVHRPQLALRVPDRVVAFPQQAQGRHQHVRLAARVTRAAPAA
jgi:hypothetical protein